MLLSPLQLARAPGPTTPWRTALDPCSNAPKEAVGVLIPQRSRPATQDSPAAAETGTRAATAGPAGGISIAYHHHHQHKRRPPPAEAAARASYTTSGIRRSWAALLQALETQAWREIEEHELQLQTRAGDRGGRARAAPGARDPGATTLLQAGRTRGDRGGAGRGRRRTPSGSWETTV